MKYFDIEYLIHSKVISNFDKELSLEKFNNLSIKKLNSIYKENKLILTLFNDTIAETIKNGAISSKHGVYDDIYNWHKNILQKKFYDITKWNRETKKVFSYLKWEKLNLLNTFNFNSFSLIINLKVDKSTNTVILSSNQYLWGEIVFTFPIAENIELYSFSDKNYLLHWFNLSIEDDKVILELKVDSNCLKEGMFNRLISMETIHEYKIISTCPLYCVKPMNYSDFIVKKNQPPFNQYIDCASELVTKFHFFGIWYLNIQERKLLDLAIIYYFFTQLDSKNKIPISLSEKSLLNDYLTNPYKTENIKIFFIENGNKKIAKKFISFLKDYSKSSHRKKMKIIYGFSKCLIKLSLQPKDNEMFSLLVSDFLSATSKYPKESIFNESITQIHNLAKEVFSPILFEKGFSGSYPNFRKKKEKIGLFVSFGITKKHLMCEEILKYKITISLAIASISRDNESKNDSCFDKATAYDFTNKKYVQAHFNFSPNTENDQLEIEYSYNENILKNNISQYIPAVNNILNVFVKETSLDRRK